MTLFDQFYEHMEKYASIEYDYDDQNTKAAIEAIFNTSTCEFDFRSKVYDATDEWRQPDRDILIMALWKSYHITMCPPDQ